MSGSDSVEEVWEDFLSNSDVEFIHDSISRRRVPHRSTGRIGAPSPPFPVPSTRPVCPAKANHFLTWYAHLISLNVLKCHVHLCLISHEAFYYLQRDDCARDSFPHHDNSESDPEAKMDV